VKDFVIQQVLLYEMDNCESGRMVWVYTYIQVRGLMCDVEFALH